MPISTSSPPPMPNREELPPDHIFLFKPIEGVQHGGCRALVWVPSPADRLEEAAPVALMYHGGGFSLGSAAEVPCHQVRYLLSKGILVVSFDYRLLPHVTMLDILEDLLDSYKYVQTGLAEDLAHDGHTLKIDPSRCSAHGWSAGGCSVIYLAGEIEAYNKEKSTEEQLPSLRCIVPTYPLVSLDIMCESKSKWDRALETNAQVKRYWEALSQEPCATEYRARPQLVPVAMNIITGKDANNTDEDLLSLEHSRIVWAVQVTLDNNLASIWCGHDAPYPDRLSGINLVNHNFPPTCVVAASADTLIPPSQSYDLYERVKQHGVEALFVECKGMAHGEAEALKSSPPWPQDNDWWATAILPSLEFSITHMTS